VGRQLTRGAFAATDGSEASIVTIVIPLACIALVWISVISYVVWQRVDEIKVSLAALDARLARLEGGAAAHAATVGPEVEPQSPLPGAE
jgi:hypothetical protein